MSQFRAGSKSAWAGNHNPAGPALLARDLVSVGRPVDQGELALLQLPGDEFGQYLAGFTVSAQAAGGMPLIPWNIILVTGDGVPVPGASLTVTTLAAPAEMRLPRPLALPPGSLWKLVALLPPGLTAAQLRLLPDTLTLTWWIQVSPAPGLPPLPAGAAVYGGTGIGWQHTGLTNRVAA